MIRGDEAGDLLWCNGSLMILSPMARFPCEWKRLNLYSCQVIGTGNIWCLGKRPLEWHNVIFGSQGLNLS